MKSNTSHLIEFIGLILFALIISCNHKIPANTDAPSVSRVNEILKVQKLSTVKSGYPLSINYSKQIY